MPKVFSRRRPHEIPTGAIYEERPSPWGNPFSKGSKGKTLPISVSMLKIRMNENRNG